MKNIKILFSITLIIVLFIYYKINQSDNNSIIKDKLSMFILIKPNKNIEDALLDLESQIESFDNYIHNVYYDRDNNYLARNKLRSQIDKDYIDYRVFFDSYNIVDFNLKIGNLIESSFINNDISKQRNLKYLLRDFLKRFYQCTNSQIEFFYGLNNNLEALSCIEDFIIGEKYFTDYRL